MSLLKNQAIQTALTGDWKSAIDLNKSLLEENPNDIEALNRMALAYTVLGKIGEAKKSYQKVLEIDALNPIALRNMKRLKNENSKAMPMQTFQVNNTFLEETGKTKVVDLVNIAQTEVISNLRIGQILELSVKRLKVFALGENGQYVGVLPDDIARRLIKFIKGGNKYEAYVKSAGSHNLTIFIRELKRSSRFKDQSSFPYLSEKGLSIKKLGKKKQAKTYEEEEPSDEEPAEEES